MPESAEFLFQENFILGVEEDPSRKGILNAT
jgi:hypothetical protein